MVAVLGKNAYDRILHKLVRTRTDAQFEFLQGSPVFQSVSVAYLKTRGWDGETHVRHKLLVREGQNQDQFFVVRSGHLELSRRVSKLIDPKSRLADVQLSTERSLLKDSVHEITKPPVSPSHLRQRMKNIRAKSPNRKVFNH
jgi:hypothetical protein